jgi:hypothetical protein
MMFQQLSAGGLLFWDCKISKDQLHQSDRDHSTTYKALYYGLDRRLAKLEPSRNSKLLTRTNDRASTCLPSTMSMLTNEPKGVNLLFLSIQDQSNMDLAFMCTKEKGIEFGNAFKQSALWCTAWKMLKLRALSLSQTRKSIGFDHSLSIGNQMSMETGPMCMDKEAFRVSYPILPTFPPARQSDHLWVES